MYLVAQGSRMEGTSNHPDDGALRGMRTIARGQARVYETIVMHLAMEMLR